MPRNAALLLVLAALLLPRPASAAVALGARAFGGYSTYAMGDWSDILRGLRAPAGSVAAEDDGYSLGVGAEFRWDPWSVTTSYERLVPGRQGEVNGEKVRLPANALLLELEYRRRVRTRLFLGVGGGGGYYQLGEEIESPGTDQNFEGNAFGARAFGLGEWTLVPAISIGLEVGYRWAAVGVDKVNLRPTTRDIEVDYSGLNSRLELRFHQQRGQ
jgi:hypothetical protein